MFRRRERAHWALTVLVGFHGPVLVSTGKSRSAGDSVDSVVSVISMNAFRQPALNTRLFHEFMAATRSPNITQERGVTVVALGSEYETLDENDLDDVKDVLLRVASTADPPQVVLDLSRTKFFGSAFIELLFRVWNRLNDRAAGRFAISGLTDYCQEVVDVTHLDRLWDVYDTGQAAVEALSAQSEHRPH